MSDTRRLSEIVYEMGKLAEAHADEFSAGVDREADHQRADRLLCDALIAADDYYGPRIVAQFHLLKKWYA